MKTRFPPPCITRNQCAEAMKMENLGYSMTAIANIFGVSRTRLIITLHNAKEFGFVYFAYHGSLLDHLDTLRALGAKRYSHGIRKRFIEHVGFNITQKAFYDAIAKIRPYL